MKKILAVILCVFSIFSLGGCTTFPGFDRLPIENGLLYWTSRTSGKTTKIMGITEDAIDENGVVEIPREIKGYKVTAMGWYTNKFVGSSGSFGGFEMAEGVKKIYIPPTVRSIECISPKEDRYFYLNVGKDINLKNLNSSSIFSVSLYENSVLVLPDKLLFDDEQIYKGYLLDTDMHGSSHKIGNVYFDTNLTSINEYYYAMDYVEAGSKIRKPKTDPSRSGHSFTGWYKEKECLNKWGFNEDMANVVMLKDSDVNLEYSECLKQYKEYLTSLNQSYKVTLYAGWLKN